MTDLQLKKLVIKHSKYLSTYLVTKIKPLDRNSCVFLGYFSELILINLVQISDEMNHRFCFIRNNTTELYCYIPIKRVFAVI